MAGGGTPVGSGVVPSSPVGTAQKGKVRARAKDRVRAKGKARVKARARARCPAWRARAAMPAGSVGATAPRWQTPSVCRAWASTRPQWKASPSAARTRPMPDGPLHEGAPARGSRPCRRPFEMP